MESNLETDTSTQQTQQLNTPPKSNKNNLYLWIILIVFMICAGTFLILQSKTTKTNNNQQMTQNPSTNMKQPTSTISPVTASNVDSVLVNTDTAIKESIDQANTDINSVSSIDSYQDSTNNL